MNHLHPVLRFLRRLGRAASPGDQTDDHLLQRFAEERDENAFKELLCRYGPLVFAVCVRVLGNEADAEDAFQATFLVLARKAASLRHHTSVAAWLQRVAANVAQDARRSIARRRHYERQATVMPPADEFSAADWRDLRPVLDEELARLPEKHRTPLVMCYFQGMSHTEAAQELGWPVGTVEGRLQRAREQLRVRLAKRGLTLSAGSLAMVLAQNVAPAALPIGLLDATARGALLFASGGAATAGMISTGAVALAQASLRSMFLTNAVWWTGSALVSVLLASSAGAVIYYTVGGQFRPQAEERVERADGPLGGAISFGIGQETQDERGTEGRVREARSARKLELGPSFSVTVSGEIRQAGERPWYQVQAVRDASLKVCLGTIGSSLDPSVTVYDAKLHPIKSTENVAGENAEVLLPADANQTYFIEVSGARDTTGGYALLLSQPKPPRRYWPPLDDHPSAKNEARVVTFDNQGEIVLRGEIATVGDEDWFTFTAARSGELRIEADTPLSSLDTHLELHDAAKLLTQGHGQRADRLHWPVKAGERYWLLARAGSEKGADDILPNERPTGGYVVRIKLENGKP